jgi:hypothetical protein
LSKKGRRLINPLLVQMKKIKMKIYTIGLITGTLLGASAMMFMRAECPNTYSDN